MGLAVLTSSSLSLTSKLGNHDVGSKFSFKFALQYGMKVFILYIKYWDIIIKKPYT